MPYQSLILLVCSANRCRSPMAEYLLRRLIAENGAADRLRVASGGTWCESGQPATDMALQAMRTTGIELSGHQSHLLNQTDIDDADLILVMTEGHRAEILARFLRADSKTYLLSEMVGKRSDINDPTGGSQAEHERLMEELEKMLEQGYARIVDLARNGPQGKRRGRRRWLGRLLRR